MTVLQTAPLPLGYDAEKIGLFKEALSERSDSNRRPSRWQRDALPAELLSQFIKILRLNFINFQLIITIGFFINDYDRVHDYHDHVND